MQIWYLTPASISYLAQFILTLAIAAYLTQLARRLWKQKSEWLATALLAGFFAAWTVFGCLAFLDVSLDPSSRLWALFWQVPAVALGLLFLLQFVYRFPTSSRWLTRESLLVLALSLWYLARESQDAIGRMAALGNWNLNYRAADADIPLVLEFLWVFVVALRQTVRASFDARRETQLQSTKFATSQASLRFVTRVWTRIRSIAAFATNVVRALVFPQGRLARAVRDFALVFFVFALLSGLQLARNVLLISNEVRSIGLSLFALVTLFASVLIYLNALPETTTFMVKLVGIALTTTLAILGTVGWLMFPSQLNAATVDAPFQSKQTLHFAPNARGGYDVRAVPFAFETEWGARLERDPSDNQQRPVQLPFPFPFYGQSWSAAYVLDVGMIGFGAELNRVDTFYRYGPTPAILTLFIDLPFEKSASARVFGKSETDRFTLTWDGVPSVDGQTTFTSQLTLYRDGVFDITYRDVTLRPGNIYDDTNPSGIIGAVPGGGRPVQLVNLATDLPYSGAAGAGVVDNLYLRLREQIHQPLLPLAYLLLASALLIIFGFPVFLRQNLVRPLDTLLDSVKRVNAGDLETKTPVQFRDEIGFLTDSFNTLTDSLRREQNQRQRSETDSRALAQSLETRVADRTRELAALYDVSAIATRAQDPETLFHDSLARAMTALGCPVGAILLVTEKKSPAEPTRLQVAMHSGLPPDTPVNREMMPAADGLFATICAQRQPTLIPDVSTDPRVPAAMHALGALAFLLAPLLVEEQVFGVIGLLRDSRQGFSIEEITLLATIAGQLSIGVQSQRVRQIAHQAALVAERQRLARDLHDSVTQSLYSVTLFAQAIRSSASAGNLSLTQQYVSRISEMAQQALKEMRWLLYELRPAVVEELGLVNALRRRLEMVERRAGVATEFVVEGMRELDAALENTVYQIAQEALNNTLKHSAAAYITLRMSMNERDLRLEIKDDGKGFDPASAAQTAGLGLDSMRERAAQLGGALAIISKPGQGTHIQLIVPLEQEQSK
ncbi:MAG: GAF domain-containing protein [Chloroflexota bacterium]|nr:GAF domain-containing protein [Chloroflexota bacterium]